MTYLSLIMLLSCGTIFYRKCDSRPSLLLFISHLILLCFSLVSSQFHFRLQIYLFHQSCRRTIATTYDALQTAYYYYYYWSVPAAGLIIIIIIIFISRLLTHVKSFTE